MDTNPDLTKNSMTTLDSIEKPKFSMFITSSIVTIIVAQSRIFYIHSDILLAESERYANSLRGVFKEARDRTLNIEDEDPELFGFFVEYMYRDQSILSREVQHYSQYVTLARLYAMGERLLAPAFQSVCLWRFTQLLEARSFVSDEGICELLQLACTEITERVREDPLRSQIFWLGSTKITTLQKSDMFRQLLCDTPDLGRHLCLWVNKDQPPKAPKPSEVLCQKFGPESEHTLARVSPITVNEEDTEEPSKVSQ